MQDPDKRIHSSPPPTRDEPSEPGDAAAPADADDLGHSAEHPAAPEPAERVTSVTDEVDRLCEDLLAHDAGRRAPAPDNGRRRRLARACCLTLMAGPPDLGIEPVPSPARDEATSVLDDAGPDDLPEAHVCRLWLSCLSGAAEADAAGTMADLARQPLWEPVRALALRALAHWGRRELLAELLAARESLSAADADAWLEAAHRVDPGEWPDGSPPVSRGPLPSDVCAAWNRLVATEHAVAFSNATTDAERALSELAAGATEAAPSGYADWERRRIAGRAAAALVRLRVAAGRGDDRLLDGPAGRHLPTWQRRYLSGLTRWVLDDMKEAEAALREAMALNPHQTCVRLALGTLAAEGDTDSALGVLEVASPTREVLVSQVALLARLGRYDEAEAALARCRAEPTPPTEAARFTWPLGRRQSRWQEHVLKTALAERRRDWPAAERAWRAACASTPGGRRPSLEMARTLFMAQVECDVSLPDSERRRRDLERRLRRAWHEIGDRPLVGHETFFRAAAAVGEHPDRAARDFKTLLGRRSWVEAERRAGGRRLIAAGDALARLGCPKDAARAYELAAECAPDAVPGRLAAMRVWQEATVASDPVAIAAAAEASPDSAFVQLMAALGLLMAGSADAARERLGAAESAGAPGAHVRCLRALCGAASGEPAALTDDDLSALRASAKTAAALRLLAGGGEESSRLLALVEAAGDDWPTACPVAPRGAACRAVAALCDAGRWDDALKMAAGLAARGENRAGDLAMLVRVRSALAQAAADPEAAERELDHLAAQCRPTGGGGRPTKEGDTQ